MDDALVVEIFAAQEDLVEEVSALRLRDRLTTLVQLHQGPPTAKLQNDVNKILQEKERTFKSN